MDLSKGLPWLKRRGPDSLKAWSSTDGQVELLFVRLAIVDTDNRAHQPLSDHQKGVTIAFVGEIYNYLELKGQLGDYAFKTNSDTEVLLALFSRDGLEGVNKVRGMFALAIVDERLRRIFLIRDPIGKKPLFWGRWQDTVLFGSSVIPLAAAEKNLAGLNNDVLEHYWKEAFIPPYTSVLKGIKPVLPGEIIELDWRGDLIRQARLELEKKYLYNAEPLEKVNETVGMLIETAVKRRLTNNPHPTILLSGGIDSTVVCAILKKVCGSKNMAAVPEAVSLRSFIPLMNDEFYARFAARRIGVPLRLAGPAKGRFADSVIRAFDLQDEPLGMPSFFLLERLVRAVSSYNKIILTGDGGDEIFLGYGKPSDWRAARGEAGVNIRDTVYGIEAPGWMSAWAKKTVTEVLLGHMLTKADRASAEQGVEIRCPLLDWDLVNYVRSLPFEILTGGNRTKALLKNQLAGWPRWFTERPKLGFAYNLRWHWGFLNYPGLRENIDGRAISMFETYLPQALNKKPPSWRKADIFGNFGAAWRLLAWSRFLIRLDEAIAAH